MDEQFEFTAADSTPLRGTLTRPSVHGPAPAALLLNGSGPLDRDSNIPGQALNVANALASALASHGLASLRYDKRGVGESEGEYMTTGFEQETGDAFAALEALRRSARIDSGRLAVIGHSVGATIAIRLAARSEPLAGVVLLACASRPGAEVMERQSARIAASLRGPSRLLSGLFLRKQGRARMRLLASTEDVIRIGRARLPARWFREFMTFDPATDLALVQCPVLAITGAGDLQVEPSDVSELGRLIRGPFTGSTPTGLTHVLRKHEGSPSLRSYPAQLKEPVDPELLEQIAAWVAARARRDA